jgi:NTE family protein
MMLDWEKSVVEFRCSLNPAELQQLRGSVDGWNCRDVRFHFGLVSFSSLGKPREAKLNAIPTRLSLLPTEIDDAIQAGEEATLGNPTLRSYLDSM